ncbi:MAG TPA: phage terminase small subunit-related protein [Ferruginibacter sp.]|nr:phage terminase small subunit-related protein [Ferruginibacter sp.]HMP22183.1 phage terminase small subunit-related protein [Ferruginibacter sp.]
MPRAKRLSNREMDNKKQQAYVMYMGFIEQKEIAEILAVSEKTISDWVAKGKWKAKRSAATVTRDELINKTLEAIGLMLDQALTSGDKNFTSITDGLAKMANVIEKLDKKNNILHVMEVFRNFNEDLIIQAKHNDDVKPDLIKLINRLQASYVNRRMNNE